MDNQSTLTKLLETMNKVKEFTNCTGEKTLDELFNMLMDEITSLRQQLAPQPNVDVLVEALRLLHEHARLYLPQYHKNQNVFDQISNLLDTYSKPITEDKDNETSN